MVSKPFQRPFSLATRLTLRAEQAGEQDEDRERGQRVEQARAGHEGPAQPAVAL